MTITEALAEIKTIAKRIQSKREFIGQYLFRQDSLKDPLEKDGGSAKAIAEAVQAIADLEQRLVDLRHAISYTNETTELTIEGVQRTIGDWLIWRREVAPAQEHYYRSLRTALSNVRDQARRQGVNILSNNNAADKPSDIIVNMSEKDIADQSEKLKNILGQLDGQLSLKNATVMVNV